MKKIKNLLLAPVFFLANFLFVSAALAVSAPAPVYGPPPNQVLYGAMPVPAPDVSWMSIVLFPVLPLLALVALIIGIVATLKRRDKTNPDSKKRSVKKIVIMIVGFVLFGIICLLVKNYLMGNIDGGQTIYGGPDMLR